MKNLPRNRFGRRRLIQGAAAAGAGTAGLALVGCGNDDDDDGVTPPPGDDDTSPGTDPTPGNGASQGGSVTMAISTVDSLDPQRGFLVVTRNLFYSIYDGLLAFDNELNVVPELATDWETPDGAVFTLNLRDGVTFHDGTPFNAEAVVANFDRLLDPATEAPDRDVFAGIVSYEAIDDLTVRFDMGVQNADFLLNLTEKAGQMLSPTAIEELGHDIGTQPVGAGPFKFEEWRQGDRVRLSRYEEYWDSGYPMLDEVVFVETEDPSVVSAALRSGDVHIGLPAPHDQDTMLDSGDFDLWEVGSVANVEDIIMFPFNSPMEDSRVRQAIVWAINREAMNTVVHNGFHTIPHGIIPPASWAYNPAIEQEGFGYDPERARQLLEAAGFEDGLEFTNFVVNSPPRILSAETMQAMLAEVGITMRIEAIESSARVERQRQGDIQATNAGFSGRISMDQHMTLNYHSLGGFNYADYAPGPRDELIEQARQSLDTEERAQLYRELEAHIVEDPAPRIPHLFRNNMYVVRNQVKQDGAAYRPDNMIRFKHVYREA